MPYCAMDIWWTKGKRKEERERKRVKRRRRAGIRLGYKRTPTQRGGATNHKQGGKGRKGGGEKP